jgi:hypothetical protein
MAGIAKAVEAKAAAINRLILIPSSIVQPTVARTTPAERLLGTSSVIVALAARESEVKIYAIFIIWTIVAIKPQLRTALGAK